MMSFLKKALAGVALGIFAVLVGGIIGFLNEAHLEVYFDRLNDFDWANLKSYPELGRKLRIEVEAATDQDYVAYWDDYDEQQKPIVRSSRISYKNFRLNNRLSGKIVDDDQSEYAVTGYYNDRKLVFVHRGPQSGTGAYFLDLVQLNGINGNIYGGYGIFEEQEGPGSTHFYVAKCPFVMIDESVAKIKFPSIEAATKAFPLLGNGCSKFEMPENFTIAEKSKKAD